MTRIKIAAVGLVAALAFVAAPAQAVTVAELQAQINALMSQLAALQGTTSTTATFTKNLTVGSTGSEVTALQQMLVSGGYLTMPQGVAYGYFGNATKAAVVKWQAAKGVSPASGYWGPLSRAAAGSVSGSTGGSTTGGTTGAVSGSISTPGAEGTLTVVAAPVSNSTLYAGDSKDAILAFKASADGSDLAIQRVKVALPNANSYNKVFNQIYLVDDAGAVVASSPLNSTTVVKDAAGSYSITLTGFSTVVKKGTSRIYTVKADLFGSIGSTYQTSYAITLGDNGVRAVDGAGIDQYSPTTGSDVSKTVTVTDSLSASADMIVSANSANPLSQEVVAASGPSNNQADKVVLLVFDIKAEKSDINVTDLKNFVISSTGAATASTTYLYEGNGTSGTLLGSVANSTNDADFTNISSTIPAGTTKTYTIAVDIRNADATQTTISGSFTGNTTDVIGLASDGSTVATVTGSATGNSILVRNVGPVFSLNGAPTISTNGVPQSSATNNLSTSTLTATFKVNVKAVGADLLLGDVGSTSPLVMETTSGNDVNVYANGTAAAQNVASTTALTFDSSFISDSANKTFKLSNGSTGTVTVTFTMQGRTVAGAGLTFGNYAVDIAKLRWVSSNGLSSSTFMSGQSAWRTPVVVMP